MAIRGLVRRVHAKEIHKFMGGARGQSGMRIQYLLIGETEPGLKCYVYLRLKGRSTCSFIRPSHTTATLLPSFASPPQANERLSGHRAVLFVAMGTEHPTTSGLKNSPADILYLIFKELSSVEYHALCLANRDLGLVAERLMYSKIKWFWGNTPTDPPPQLPQLVRTLFSRPVLATYITQVHLDGNNWLQNTRRWNLPRFPLADADLEKPSAFIRRIGVPYADVWIEGLRDGNMDALLALLLSQLSNLRRLHLGFDFTRRSALIGMLLRSALYDPEHNHGAGAGALPTYQHLHDVSFLRRVNADEAFHSKTRNTADVLPFFYLPNVQCIAASVQNPLDVFVWPAAATHKPCPSQLTSLDLRSIREGCLGELLAVTPNLEILHWEWYFDNGVADRFTTQTIDLDRIGRELSLVSSTLTELTISAEIGIAFAVGDQFWPGLKAEGSLAGLAGMHKIQRLCVPWAFLAGFVPDTTSKRLPQDVLPRNVEFLTVTDDLALQGCDYMDPWPPWEWSSDAMLEVLRAWLDDWKACTPRLRGITMRISYLADDTELWCAGAGVELRELGTQCGVPIEVIEVSEDF
ncbi:hypothetical protein BJY01DRAFT_245548 [Aspergillus pseudoustus]|uniref:F-box domain-containing protein n=1 Tax=Aspergillus pseudoustus TaxID=1810923 RepID=A0ABR4KD81_9EURO